MSKFTKILCLMLAVVFVTSAMLFSCTDKDETNNNGGNETGENINGENQNNGNNGANGDVTNENSNPVFDDEGNEMQMGDNEAQWQW